MQNVVGLIFLAIVVAIAVQVYWVYRSTTGTAWERLLATARGSATILWSKLVALVGALLGAASSLADALNMPGVSESIQAAMPNAGLVAAVVIGIAVITVWARKRTL